MPAYTNIHFGFFRLERGEEEMEEYDIRLLSTKMHQNAHRFFIQNQDKPGVSQPRSSLVSFIGVFERISGQSQETEQ
jgi:hemerythrin